MEQKIRLMIMEITQDRKKFGVMCTLLAMGILLWARLIILQDVPKTGFAAPSDAENSEEAGSSVPGGNNGAQSVDESDLIAELPIIYLDTDAQLARDFFERLTIAPVETEESTQLPSVDSKSETEQPEDSEEVELERRRAVEKAATALRLESILGGSRPIAVINGRVVTPGDTVDGFVLETVGKRMVVLRSGDFRVELELQ